VKKNKHRVKSTFGKGKPAPPPLQEPTPHRRSNLFWATRWGILFVVGLAGLIASVVQIWGPFWPIEPAFAPGMPSSGFALDIPFTVSNKSALFSIKRLNINCGLHSVTTANGGRFENFGVSALGGQAIAPAESRPYSCPLTTMILGLSNEKITEGVIEFSSEYDSPWPWPWNKRKRSSSGLFTLNTKTIPPQWMSGVPLQ
jgi:hypothetical protein